MAEIARTFGAEAAPAECRMALDEAGLAKCCAARPTPADQPPLLGIARINQMP